MAPFICLKGVKTVKAELNIPPHLMGKVTNIPRSLVVMLSCVWGKTASL